MNRYLLISFLLMPFTASSQFTTTEKNMYSAEVKDSFEIYSTLPANYQPAGRYKVVYYFDANLKSGKELRAMLSGQANGQLSDYIFIGIGHIGNYHVLRRRDFILPVIKNHDTLPAGKNYGGAAQFYSFLTKELIPQVNRQYHTYADSNSVIGHSLGGLFVFYCLFRNASFFSNYFALSPALWVDNYAIYQFSQLKEGPPGPRTLYLACGGAETMNYILAGCNKMSAFLGEKNYPPLRWKFEVWPGETHNSEVPLSLKRILTEYLQ